MTRKLLLLLVAVVVTVWNLVPTRAYADLSGSFLVPTCSNTYLDTWDWVSDLKTQTGYADFGASSASYIIYIVKPRDSYSNTNGTAERNAFKIIRSSSNTDKFHLGIDGTTSKPTAYAKSYQNAQIISEPVDANDVYKKAWQGFGDGAFTVGGSVSTSGKAEFDSASIACVYAAKNVTYDSTWTYRQFSSSVAVGTGTGSSCKLTDVGCIVSKAFGAIDEAFQAVGMAIVEALGALFVPDTDMIKGDFDSFTSTLDEHLGFLVYPLTFLVDFFNSFTDTSNTWCTATSCHKDFGDVYGHDFDLNVLQLKSSFPTAWTYLVGAARGLAVLECVLLIRKSYMGVMRR